MPHTGVASRAARRSRDAATGPKKRGPGRPKHKEDPPVILATTIPKSLDRASREHAKVTSRPRSEHLADAIRAYKTKKAALAAAKGAMAKERQGLK